MALATENNNGIKPSRLKAESGETYCIEQAIRDGAERPHPMTLIELLPVTLLLLPIEYHTQVVRSQVSIFVLVLNLPTDAETCIYSIHTPCCKFMSAATFPIPT